MKEDLQVLTDLGLNLLQAKVYLSLAEIGKSDVKKISKVSKVARPDVYRALSQLKELGLIEEEIIRPTRFRAIPTEIALDTLLERKATKYRKLKSKTQSLISRFKRKNNKVVSDKKEAEFIFVPSQEAVIQRLKKAIEGTNASVDIVTSCKRFKFASYCMSEDIKGARLRGVKFRVIIEETGEKEMAIMEEFWKNPMTEVKYASEITRTFMALYDKKEVFIFTLPEADLKESPALWSNDSSLVGMADTYFELIWSKAHKEKE